MKAGQLRVVAAEAERALQGTLAGQRAFGQVSPDRAQVVDESQCPALLPLAFSARLLDAAGQPRDAQLLGDPVVHPRRAHRIGAGAPREAEDLQEVVQEAQRHQGADEGLVPGLGHGRLHPGQEVLAIAAGHNVVELFAQGLESVQTPLDDCRG